MNSLEKLIDLNNYLILFRYIPTKQWISCDITRHWYLSNNLEMSNASLNCYEYINEIMHDLNCKRKDIDIIEIKQLA